MAVVFTEAGREAAMPGSLAEWARETELAWERRIERAEQSMPQLTNDIQGLEDYFHRSLMSGLICLWEHPDFKIRPLPSVPAIDGGGINSYPWDAAGYVGQSLAMLLGPEKSLIM